ncbi:MAG: hypothetical protein HKN23_06170 [Verrucomicrobiales bacterium]|nr:hypothetical protein [Verrucomicrobiales bacterium]
MKQPNLLLTALSAFVVTFSIGIADENHEIIEKVMKQGLKAPKGEDSPMDQVLNGDASKEDTAELLELVKTMHGTKAPVGNQDEYETKVKELIEALEAVAGGDLSEKALNRLEEAQNCKACHSNHKPKKKG